MLRSRRGVCRFWGWAWFDCLGQIFIFMLCVLVVMGGDVEVDEERVVEVLSEKRALAVLLSLSDFAKSIRHVQRGVGGSAETAGKRLRELRDVGLVEEIDTDYERKRMFRLTRRGRYLARMIDIGINASDERVRDAFRFIEDV